MKNRIKRAIVVVLDGAGVGYLPDAADFDDEGANTLGNVAKYCGGLHLPNMERLGLGHLTEIEGVEPSSNALGAFGKSIEASKGKDTTVGHWEIGGVILGKAFPTYFHGFPKTVVDSLEKRTGRKVLGNKPASGTEIIDELGQEQMKTGAWIVYTSADSVFQIASHQDTIPLDELYEACETALEICSRHAPVARVIARPYRGPGQGSFFRTIDRRDFSVPPPEPTVLDKLKGARLDVVAVGKIKSIFAGRGITDSRGVNRNNLDGVEKTIQALKEDSRGIVFTNLVDFDMVYGHRRDPHGYKNALEEFDAHLPRIMGHTRSDDILILTADHGCDPTFKGTDHTREYAPILVYGKNVKRNIDLGTRGTLADIAHTIEELVLGNKKAGSFAEEILDPS
ncbi:MAG: phosphopentomutase [Proteobacteria bacterium]|nr:phosphopentomutase [Pseudomonadota bacterium]